ncbi:hypothetical protein BB559_001902 [Furculomyces boomerangus]|uniref:Uncharacterized protein n=1 Tax=Furculomyces boomerangus TaxID=61424 RepID=A0A2T9YZT6_9FUNG|nr:hypothetical protein BB559_001902 [Furculomyces boomerangus]
MSQFEFLSKNKTFKISKLPQKFILNNVEPKDLNTLIPFCVKNLTQTPIQIQLHSPPENLVLFQDFNANWEMLSQNERDEYISNIQPPINTVNKISENQNNIEILPNSTLDRSIDNTNPQDSILNSYLQDNNCKYLSIDQKKLRRFNQMFNEGPYINQIELNQFEEKTLFMLVNTINTNPSTLSLFKNIKETPTNTQKTQPHKNYKDTQILFKGFVLLESTPLPTETPTENVPNVDQAEFDFIFEKGFKKLFVNNYSPHINFYNSVPNATYTKEIEITNQGTIPIDWTILLTEKKINVENSQDKANIPLTRDQDESNETLFPIIQILDQNGSIKNSATLNPNQTDTLRLVYNSGYEDQIRCKLILQDFDNSSNKIEWIVSGKKKENDGKHRLELLENNELDFGLSASGSWVQQKLVFKNNGDQQLCIKFQIEGETTDLEFQSIDESEDFQINTKIKEIEHEILNDMESEGEDFISEKNESTKSILYSPRKLSRNNTSASEKYNTSNFNCEQNALDSNQNFKNENEIPIIGNDTTNPWESLNYSRSRSNLNKELLPFALRRNAQTEESVTSETSSVFGSSISYPLTVDTSNESPFYRPTNSRHDSVNRLSRLSRISSTSSMNEINEIPEEYIARKLKNRDERSSRKLEDLFIKPGATKSVHIFVKQKPKNSRTKNESGEIVQHSFSIECEYSSFVNGLLQGRRSNLSIPCVMKSCTSLISASPEVLDSGPIGVGTVTAMYVNIKNLSDIEGQFRCSVDSKIVNCIQSPINILPRDTISLRIDIYPRRINPRYRKQINIVNLRNRSQPDLIINVKSEHVDLGSMSYHNLLYKTIFNEREQTFVDFGQTPINSPVLRMIHLKNICNEQIELEVTPENTDVLTVYTLCGSSGITLDIPIKSDSNSVMKYLDVFNESLQESMNTSQSSTLINDENANYHPTLGATEAALRLMDLLKKSEIHGYREKFRERASEAKTKNEMTNVSSENDQIYNGSIDNIFGLGQSKDEGNEYGDKQLFKKNMYSPKNQRFSVYQSGTENDSKLSNLEISKNFYTHDGILGKRLIKQSIETYDKNPEIEKININLINNQGKRPFCFIFIF